LQFRRRLRGAALRQERHRSEAAEPGRGNVRHPIKLGLIAATLALALAPRASAIELRFATGFPASHLMQKHVWEPWAEEVAKKSNGTLTIRMFPGGALGPAPATYQRVKAGVADIGYSLQGFTSDQFPRTLLAEMPDVAQNNVTATRKLWAAYDLLKDDYQGVKVIGLFSTGPNIIATRDKPVRVPDDIKGMRIRVPSKLVGESPVFMNITEVYNAVQTGVLGGVATGTSALRGFKLGEVLRYYNDYAFGVSPMFVVMNQASYDKLSPEHKKLIDDTTGLNFSLKGAKVYDDEAVIQLKEEVDRGRGQATKVTVAERAIWDKAIRGALDKAVAERQAIGANRILDAMRKAK
jgi:TRAP-type C4-dicarboxylate transport system substrate-binding protein